MSPAARQRVADALQLSKSRDATYGIGIALALSQDSSRSQDFLMLWKDADADMPILKQVKAEYAKPQ